jgi:hypothetical protein
MSPADNYSVLLSNFGENELLADHWSYSWLTNELNSKFDKCYKIFSKSYHKLISKENHCLFA